jgi:hypothetical protein
VTFGKPVSMDLRSIGWDHMLHLVREFIRSHQWCQLSVRRPDTFAGIELGIARSPTLH